MYARHKAKEILEENSFSQGVAEGIATNHMFFYKNNHEDGLDRQYFKRNKVLLNYSQMLYWQRVLREIKLLCEQ